ncbi:MAG: HD domain-containing protein [Candidatus Methanofastidiosum sp.]|nr:HD domain-containing protein [Methanofastidiosum sp.]
MIELFLIVIIVSVGLLWWALKPTKSGNTSLAKNENGKQEIHIEDVSILWTKRKEAVIKLEELSRLWRNSQANVEQSDIPHFFTDVIREFFKKHIDKKPFYTGGARKVINNLLTLLDTEGAVASVVSGQNETESKIPQDTYKMLAQVSLAEHTVHVAEEILTIVPYSANLPIALIAALAHDIGKIPKYRKQYYALGDHPFISVTVLESISGFKDLVYADEIIQAVRDHHLKPKNYVGEVLKEADTRARRRELVEVQKKLSTLPPPDAFEHSDTNVDEAITPTYEKLTTETNTNQTLSNSSNIPTKLHLPPHQTQLQTQHQPQPQSPSQSQSQPTHHRVPSNSTSDTFASVNLIQSFNKTHMLQENSNTDDTIPEIFNYQPTKTQKSEPVETSADVFFNTQSATTVEEEQKPKEIEMQWFNPEEFLSKVLTYVNKLINGRWLAVSMPNGIVYVQPRLFWSVLFEMAIEKGIMDIGLSEKDDATKRNYLYTVLKQIQHYKNAVETSLIREGYFSAPFIVEMRNGKKYRNLYIPLRAQEAFGVLAGELEARKEGKLKEIVDVYPPFEKGTENV